MPHRRADALPKSGVQSPFARLRGLLDAHQPGRPAISLAIGEPRHPAGRGRCGADNDRAHAGSLRSLAGEARRR